VTLENTLLERARAGDRQAFAELTEPCRERLQRYLATHLGDDAVAEDLVQEVLLSAWTHIGGFAGRSRLSTWLYQIAVNAARGHMRKAKRREQPTSESQIGDRAHTRRTVLSSLVRREAAAALELALSRLPPTLGEAFLLHHVEGLSYEEIAEITGVKESTLYLRVHRARTLLKVNLET
jgi:RNA polymerase sigma-70 factor (ECF subfamily)